IDIAGVDRLVEGDAHVALSAEVVDFVWLDDLDQLLEPAAVGKIAVVQDELRIRLVQVLEDVDDTAAVERGRAANDAVNLVAFFEEKLGQIGAILARDAGDERAFHPKWPFTVRTM